MDRAAFEQILDLVCDRLRSDVRAGTTYHKPAAFEAHVRAVMGEVLSGTPFETAPNVNQGFPDIVVGAFGVEVKATESDSWRCIANSVSEGQRAKSVDHVYVIYGKMGGVSDVKWADYGQSIIHVRTSHVPRFELEIGSDRSLFDQMGTTYEDFRTRPMHEKMPFIRGYARSRLKPGERLWWLEDTDVDEQAHSLSLSVKIYMDLPAAEKRQMRAEAALMCPAIVGHSRKVKRKYDDAVTYLMIYRGVLCSQARDLFSAGSVAGTQRGGNYLLRALLDIQDEMRHAAQTLEDALFAEYWGVVPAKEDRICEWLRRADAMPCDWTPSDQLFLAEQRKIETSQAK